MYFGTQDYQSTGGDICCFVSNDLGHSTRYGTASNCGARTDEFQYHGTAWSNAVYAISSSQPTICTSCAEGSVCTLTCPHNRYYHY